MEGKTPKKLVYIPFHDWRKIVLEGARTRDAHCIEEFRKSDNLDKLLIINRPITLAELILKKRTFKKQLSGTKIKQFGKCVLYQIDSKTYVLDCILNQSMAQIFKKRSWYFEAYKDKSLEKGYLEAVAYLNIEHHSTISANIFASGFSSKIINVMFDAWDNFCRMPGLISIKKELEKAYNEYAKSSSKWVTNSVENKEYYTKHFQAKSIEIITNGVDGSKFLPNLPLPEDLSEIRKNGNLVAGFGGKITHLFDSDIFNFITEKHPKINFVIVGQILDNEVFKKIILRPNVYYLGDKSYNVYPNYVSNFDIGIVPYRVKEGQHGGDSIKVYEYLSAGLVVIGTIGNGLQNLEKYINLANNKEEFSELLSSPKAKEKFSSEEFSWKSKCDKMLEMCTI